MNMLTYWFKKNRQIYKNVVLFTLIFSSAYLVAIGFIGIDLAFSQGYFLTEHTQDDVETLKLFWYITLLLAIVSLFLLLWEKRKAL